MKIPVRGKTVDEQTRCIHYHSPLDIIAIRFNCCDTYYPCYDCHSECADHAARIWKKSEFHTKAVLCGACSFEMTIDQYLSADNHCPGCGAAFNPRCANHHHLYFEP